jgi:hypothetical protein
MSLAGQIVKAILKGEMSSILHGIGGGTYLFGCHIFLGPADYCSIFQDLRNIDFLGLLLVGFECAAKTANKGKYEVFIALYWPGPDALITQTCPPRSYIRQVLCPRRTIYISL